MELVGVTDNVAYIPGAVNIGVLRNGKRCTVIDTGLDKNSGRSIRKVLEAEGLKLEAIINTHSHADHFGGNDYLARNLNAEVYVPAIESGIIQNPILEPIYLFHGATPIRNLRNKFVLAKPSPVDHIIGPGKLEVIGLDLEIIPLPGHCFNQIGVLVDNVLFCADTVFSERVINKYKIPVVQDVGRHLDTLEKLRVMEHNLFVPAHTKPVEDIKELVTKNISTTHGILDDIKRILEEPKTTERLMSKLCTDYELDLTIVQQYYLIHMTIMAYLGYMYDEKQIDIEMEENLLRWKISP
ncbi:MBL fold metallo-hydrolase [Candidatus Bathyarchaeota archaeon]|nr:MBL fold metallo-hydrolase [Candidatus Bathyarchaeota archaeon]MBT7187133.1 MBL fold metallo-hydrolase [Candidatus Bathyarchaeota archaeon]